MLVNGSREGYQQTLGLRYANDKKNDRAKLKEIRGLAATNPKDSLPEIQQDARHARCKNLF
jgi:hypothetical protein